MIIPDWNVPAHVKALSTTRIGGFSQAPFYSNNLGLHVGDNSELVQKNRALLAQELPSVPIWLEQQHTTAVVDAANLLPQPVIADASVSRLRNVVCCVMTADCLPILLTNSSGSQVAAVHAGWRGLCDGIIEKTIASFSVPPSDIIVWLGPAIGASAFEVGDDVLARFCAQHSDDQQCFIPHGQRYLADIYQLARNRLHRLGIGDISGGQYCTHTQSQQFFSYRRDGQTGRMATLIWFE